MVYIDSANSHKDPSNQKDYLSAARILPSTRRKDAGWREEKTGLR
jgi:hypothetical protein